MIFKGVLYVAPRVITPMIDFPFTAGGKLLAAGWYEFTLDPTGPVFQVQGEGKHSALAAVLTRLAAAIHTTPADAHIVFDKVADAYFLSEIWIPGQDGYLLQATKGRHEHKVINVKY